MRKKCPSPSGRKELDGDGVKGAGNSPGTKRRGRGQDYWTVLSKVSSSVSFLIPQSTQTPGQVQT